MAVMSSFKQQCPSCEAMISVKESMIGKKVECTKCKDKFIAERPEDDEADDTPPAKRDTKLQTKKNTPPPPTGNGKSSAAGKRAKVQVEDDADDDEEVQTKSTKPKGASNGKANGKASPAKARDEEDTDSEEQDGAATKKKGGAGSNKLVLGLALAVVGIVLLIAAGFFFMRPPRTPVGPGNQGGDDKQANDDKKDKDKDKDTGGKKDDKQETAGGSLTDVELAKLSNLLPNDTEDVFHVFMKDLFSVSSPLRDSVFQTPGALDDADLQKKIGFSVLAIDDLICAKKHTAPAWRYTVVHFKDPIKEADLKSALKLTPITLDGQNCYKLADGNAWFDLLARFSFGIPNHLRSLDTRPRDKPSYVRVHNTHTLIIGDETPVTEFLKAKGQFKELSSRQQSTPPKSGGKDGGTTPGQGMTGGVKPPTQGAMGGLSPGLMGGASPPTPGGMGGLTPGKTGMMGGASPPTPGGMAGGLTPPGSKSGANQPGGTHPADDPRAAAFAELMNHAATTTSAGDVEYFTSFQATPPGNPPGPPGGGVGGQNPGGGLGGGLGGGAPGPGGGLGGGLGGTPGPGGNPNQNPNPPTPTPTPRDDMYLTIKPGLKAILDRMELRGIDTKDKALFSSATDMEASRIETNLPEFKNAVVRRPRQFWDVTILLTEQKPRIRNLGAALIQKSTLKYQLRNEIQCIQEIDAKEFELELTARAAQQVAKFIQNLIEHEVRLPGGEKKDTAVSDQKAENQASQDANQSQITVAQKLNTVDFVLDLVLDTPALLQVQAIASLSASVLRVEMEAATNLSLRHGLANAGKLLGERGLSQRQVAPNRLPPGAFQREAEKRDVELRSEREPINRISWMAALLPHMGHETLFNKINFKQSWREPGNWTAGNTLVPQFLDPSYPDRTRYLAVKDLSLDFAATHFVGMAGIGLDAASYKRGDPATDHKRGPLSYDDSASLEEIRKGRGVSNVILMIQVPHEQNIGVSPWIAGGGATLRGVPEDENPLGPFVLSTDRDGKTINHQGKRGTYVLMVDGSVRFIDQNIAPEVFKAMCTIGGPAPKNFDLDKNPGATLIPAPGSKGKAPAKPIDKPATPIEPVKQPAATPPAVEDTKLSLQGTWIGKSMEADGKALPASEAQRMVFQFQDEKLRVRGNFKDDREEVCTYNVDAKKSPMHLEFTPPASKTILCIFELNKDELKICMRHASSSAGRPTVFATQPESQLVHLVLTRKK